VGLSYDPHDPQNLEAGVPFDHLARIRRDEPICPTPTGALYLSRRADVETVLKDVDTFHADLGPMTGLAGVEVIPADQWFLSEIPEPRHGRIRRLFNASFGPHRTRAMTGFVTHTCNGLVDDLLAKDCPDLHEDYAMPIPSLVMAEVLGLPPAIARSFMDWSFDGSLIERPASPGVVPGGPAVQAYFTGQLAAQRSLDQPTNHVFGLFMGAEIEGAALSDQEIVTELHFMIQAGVHTTRGLLIHVVQRLLESAELFAALKADRGLVVPFVEETLRHDSPVQRVTRRCMRPTVVGSTVMTGGEWLEVGIASANRDEAIYDGPEDFRLDRPDPRDHLAFGGGSHVCPGATLARMEAVIAVGVLLDRLDGMSMVDGVRYPPIPGSLSHAPVPATLVPAGTGQSIPA
jgi:cytochrome P450